MSEFLWHLKRSAYLLTSISAIILTFMPSCADVPRLPRGFVAVLFWVCALGLLAAREGLIFRADLLACCSSAVPIGTSVFTLIAVMRNQAFFHALMGHSVRLIMDQLFEMLGRGLWLVLLSFATYSFLMATWLVLTEHVRSVRFRAGLNALLTPSQEPSNALGFSGIEGASNRML